MSSALLRQDFVPMVTGYVIVMATLGLGLRLSRRSWATQATGRYPRAGAPAEAADAAPGRDPAAGPPAEAGEPAPARDSTAAEPAKAGGAAPARGSTAGVPAEVSGAAPARAAHASGEAQHWRRPARLVVGTMVGGYLLLMVVVILYYYLVARVGGAFIKSAFTGCAMLIGLAAPVWAAASWLTERRRHRAAARPAHPKPR